MLGDWKLGMGGDKSNEPNESTSLLPGTKKSLFTSAAGMYLWYINEYNERTHLVFGGIWLVFGVVVFQAITSCLVLTAIYLIVQILTTIGYGDVVPTTVSGKYETSFYALGTIIFLGSCFNVLLNAISERMEAMAEHAQKQQLARTVSNIEVDPDSHHEHAAKKLFGVWHDCLWEFMIFCVFVASGTIFYATYEACTCSYGVTTIIGCSDTSYEVCVTTGGSTKTWIDSFYMVIITLTTVGFGDYTPQSYLGRIVFIPWALLGVVCMGRFATNFGASLSRAATLEEPCKSKKQIRQDLGEILGKDPETGRARETLSLAEFSWFLLKENGHISAHSEKVAYAAFGQVDWAKKESITFDDTISYVQDHLEDFVNDDD